MKAFYYSGWFLAVLSFISGGAEIVAMSRRAGYTAYLSAYETWYTLGPASLVNLGVSIKKTAFAWAWDPIALTFLQLPGWLLLGLPAAVLIIRCRPPKPVGEDEETDLLSIYEQLSDRAREDDTFDTGEDDMAPTHFEPDPDGFEPSDHNVESRQPDFDTWDQVDWADPNDAQYVHMRFDEDEGDTKDELTSGSGGKEQKSS